MGEPVALDALGPRGAYRSRNREVIADISGTPVAELSLVPPIFVTRALGALRKAVPLAPDERARALDEAGRLFRTTTIAGQSPEQYQYLVSRVSGVPISLARSCTELLPAHAGQAFRTIRQARPAGALECWRDPLTRTGSAVWTRRGKVFAVLTSGNHPAVHAPWLEALALGYQVAVRPSRREPFTAFRLVHALWEAGFGPDQVVLLPTDHGVADEILRGADLGMVYGGDDVVAKYGAHPHVLPQGPGRSKILVTADVDWRAHLDTMVSSISHQGGTACTNATAVLVEGDPAPVAEAIAERLAALPALPPEDPKAVLPALPYDEAKAVERCLLERAAGSRAVLGGEGVLEPLPGGGAVLRPAVHAVPSADAKQVGVELPFPCVWVAPWNRTAGIAPLRNSLVVTAMTRDESLVDLLLEEPTISNVYLGNHPTHWLPPGIPHDGYLAEFLMRTKAVIRD